MVTAILNNLIELFFNTYVTMADNIYSFYFAYSRMLLDILHIVFDISFKTLLYVTMAVTILYILISFSLPFRKKEKQIKVPSKLPVVTVQIPTYNELAAINCAKNCLKSDYPKDRLQIIIGDDSSNPIISRKIDKFAALHKIVDVTRRGANIGFKPGNLNYMLKFTKGEIIIIFDSDFLPEPDFIKRIIAPFYMDNNISVVQSRWKINNFNQNIVSILGGTISLMCHHIFLSFMHFCKGNSFLCGSAEAIRKKDLLEVGGWQNGSLTEDIECSLRLMKNGKRLYYLESLECDCEVPFMFKDLCRQQMRWAFGVISAFKIHLFDLLKNKTVRARDKFNVLIFASGYLFTFLLLGITVLGILSVVSTRPAPIDWARFLSETGRNMLVTCGFIFTSIIALTANKKVRQLPKMLAASFSVGLVVTYYVNIGILKAIFDRNMQWFMLNKNGNRLE